MWEALKAIMRKKFTLKEEWSLSSYFKKREKEPIKSKAT